MSLFPRFSSSLYTPFENDFRSLFRLMDNVSSRYENSMPTTTSIRAFAPRFDVQEKDDAYLLHGELPGIDQKDIEIEFTDAHTLVVKGGIESQRERHGGPGEEDSNAANQIDDTAQKSGKPDAKAQPADQDNLAVTTTDGNKEIANVGDGGAKWWVSERTAGEFYRSFSFPSRVDSEAVNASLSKGVLSIVVPKMKQKKEGKKITIEQVE